MIRAVSASVTRSLLNSFPPDQAYRPADFEREPMPSAISHFLRQQLYDEVSDRLSFEPSPWYEESDPDVRQAWENFRKSVRNTACYPAASWSDSLSHSVDTVIRFLAKPTDTLTSFVYPQRQGTLPISTIQRRLAYFFPYSYLREIIEGYFERKEFQEIDAEQFHRLMTRIDRRMVENYENEDWVRLLDPLFELAALSDQSEDRRIAPTAVLRTFFEEKGRDDIRRLLLREENVNDREVLSQDQLLHLMNHAADTPAPVEAPPPKTQHEVYSPPRGARTTDGPQPAGDEAIPLWKRFADSGYREGPDSPHHFAAPPAAAPPPPPSGERARRVASHEPSDAAKPLWTRLRSTDSGRPHDDGTRDTEPAGDVSQRTELRDQEKTDESGQPLWKRFAKGGEEGKKPNGRHPAQPDELEVIESQVLGRIDTDRRNMYVDKLFKGSRQDYQRTLEEIARAADWARASQIIAREIFKKNQVNIYSEPAIVFTDAVEARFNQPQRHV